MLLSTRRRFASPAKHALRLLVLLVLAVSLLPATSPARAEGGRDMLGRGGYRAHLEFHSEATSAGIPRQTTIKAFVRAGETISIGSSAMGVRAGDVVIRAPTDTTPAQLWPIDPNAKTCRKRATDAAYGRIQNLAQELAGPAPAAGGYAPCVVTALETGAAGDGIWEFDFISPNPANGLPIPADPAPIRVGDEWAIPARAAADTSNHWINAWDVSVRGAGGAEVPGRVFANYLALNMGGNAGVRGAPADLGLSSTFYIQTFDGYGYKVDMNGIDPFAFIFFANADGIVDQAGRPIYRSIQLAGNNATQRLPTDLSGKPIYSVHNPRLPDNFAKRDITHKIFFDVTGSVGGPDPIGPDPTMPQNAPSPSGPTWLLSPPVAPPTPQQITYTGQEGTPGQGGTNPLGGYFSFEASENASYDIILDLDRNGVFGNRSADPTQASDRIIRGPTELGVNRVYWDGLDGAGRKVSAGALPFSAQLTFLVGEVHFPFIDAENHVRGHRLERVVGASRADQPDPSLVYYDDVYNYRTGVPYDWSICADSESATSPPASLDIPAPKCYGAALDARSAILGTPSIIPGNAAFTGAHQWSRGTTGSGANGFGDRRLINTWTYYPSTPVTFPGVIKLAEAELSIKKTHEPALLTPGGPITYTVTVSNAGPTAALGAVVSDTIPSELRNVTWTCAVSRPAPAGDVSRCGAASGSGNILETVDLSAGADIAYTIVGTVDPDVQQPIVNKVRVRRPNDTTDPNPNNNEDTNIAPIQLVADLELNKTLLTPPPLATNSVIEFSIALRNRGPSSAGNVAVLEQLPAGLTFEGATPSKGSYDSTSGIWTVGTLARDEVVTLNLRARWDGRQVVNTAQVNSSDKPDPDSTPGNNRPEEDDQSSVPIPAAVADLELKKTVSTPRVNVGQNAVFTIELTNKGPDTATGVRVAERMPSGLAFVKATPSAGTTYDDRTGEWIVGTLAKDAKVTLAIEVTVTGVGPFTNSAEVSRSDQFDPDSTPNNDNPREDDQDFATIGGDSADLSLVKRVNTSTPAVGEVITYTLVLQNDGPSTATGVEVTDKLPAGLEYVSHSVSQGAYDQATGAWAVGTVQSGANATLNISARVRSFARIVNAAEVSKSDQPDKDSTPGNGVPSEDDSSSVPLTPQVADLELRKVASTSRPAFGSTLDFTIELTNKGPLAATGVQVRERLPAGLSYVSHTTVPVTTTYDSALGIWDVGLIEVGEVFTLTLRARMDGFGPFTNSAEVSKSDQFDPDSTPGNNLGGEDDQSSATVSSPSADLSVSKRATGPRPNTLNQATYTVGVHNAGPDPATGVIVGERLPAGSTLLSSTPSKGTYAAGSWTVGGLAVGETALLTLTVQLAVPAPAGGYVNVVEVTASDLPDPDSTPNNNNPNEDDQSKVTLPSGVIDLELDKSVVALPKLDQGALFVIDLVNKGPDPASGVEVEDKLPAGLRFVSASPTKGSYDPQTGRWVVGDLGVNEVARLLIAVQIEAAANARIVNFAQVTKANEHDVDSTPNNRPLPPAEGQPQAEDDEDAVYFSLLTPVTLKSLTATPTAAGVRIAWQTGAEFDTAGFYLYRATGANRAAAVRITSSLVAARGDGAGGASYSFVDGGGAPGTASTYWLAEVSRGGAVTEYGPVSVAALRPQVWLPVVRP